MRLIQSYIVPVLVVQILKDIPNCMEIEGLLRCCDESATKTCPEPDKVRPQTSLTLILQDT